MTLTIDQALRKAVEAHKAGQIQDAEDLYRAIIKKQPKHPDANHNLGVIAMGSRKLDVALSLFKSALESRPSTAQFWLSYIDALLQLGRQAEAKRILEQARLNGAKGDNFDKLEARLSESISSPGAPLSSSADEYQPGNVLDTLELDQAIKLARKKLKARANDEAEQIYRDILKKYPYNKKAKEGLAAILRGTRGKATKRKEPPQNVLEPLMKLYEEGRMQQVLEVASRLTQDYPHSSTLFNICGIANAALKNYDAALESYDQAIAIQPGGAELYNNMGIVLRKKGELKSSIEVFKKALKIKPDNVEAYYNMGNAYKDLGKPKEAIKSYKQVLKIKPDYYEAIYNMGNALKNMGELDEAINRYTQVLKIKPDYADVESNLLHQKQVICEWSDSSYSPRVCNHLGITTDAVSPFRMIVLDDDPIKQLQRSQKFASEMCNVQPIPILARETKPLQKIRVGYFSADYREHPIAFLMAKIFESHNRELFEIYGYSLNNTFKSDIRSRLENGFDNFREIQNLSDAEVVALARQDRIDIAIDLTGYTEGCRPNIFALRAAPIQINFLGYPGTMGADFVDYIIVDKNLMPIESQEFYSEKPIYMPHQFIAQDDSLPIPNEIPPRSELGLPEEGFVFCAFHNTYKITPSVFDIWMRLLRNIPGSVLWFNTCNRWAKTNLSNEAKTRGIDSNRLIFKKERVPREEYHAQFGQADLFLDTFNYSAGSTAIDALWGGIPVLTKLGKSFSTRMAGSFLYSIGLPELVTTTEKEYEEVAIELARDPVRIKSIRAQLAASRMTSPLFNAELFTRHLEDGYKQVYQTYVEGKELKSVYVSA
jgi:predicted O-linked N-acetylglucosamine transferase (SPINDLY family)